MGRTATPKRDLVADVPFAEELHRTQNLTAIARGLSSERDLVNQLLGQTQMAGAFEDFSRTVRISKLAHVKEHKLYRALAGMKSPHGAESLRGTWQEFCGLLNRSVDQVDRDIANLQTFGEEALESMSRMGIGYRELSQYRRLPADEKAALIEAAKSGDPETFIDLAEQLLSQHRKDKAALENQLQATQENYQALGEVVQRKDSELNRAREDLEKARRRIQSIGADDAAKQLRQEVVGIAFEAEADITGKLRAAFDALNEHAQSTGTDHRSFQAQLIAHLQKLLRQLISEFQLPEVEASEEDFSWMAQDLAVKG